MNYIMIGMPGSGKSTIGVILAKVLGYKFVDCDLEIQQKTGKLLYELIAENGAEGFLKLEDKLNAETDACNSVIATGGSAVYGEKSMKKFRENGKCIYIRLSLEEVEKRLGDLTKRGVVLRNGQNLKSAYIERCELYEKYADITVDCDGMTINESLDAIIDAISQ